MAFKEYSKNMSFFGYGAGGNTWGFTDTLSFLMRSTSM